MYLIPPGTYWIFSTLISPTRYCYLSFIGKEESKCSGIWKYLWSSVLNVLFSFIFLKDTIHLATPFHRVQVGLELTMWPRMTLHSSPSCFHHLSIGLQTYITDIHHYVVPRSKTRTSNITSKHHQLS